LELCLGVNARDLVMNVILKNLGCLELWWLGVFIALNHQQAVWGRLLSMGANHVIQPLGYWSSRPLKVLSSSVTGQSGAPPDRYCLLSGAPLTLRL
jgi:hypothetical protein